MVALAHNGPEIIAATYERVSTRAQGRQGFSLIAQHQSGGEFAAAQGWYLAPELRFRDGEDVNASGADWDLPGLNAMIEAAQRREFHVLIVPDLDRFARSMVKGLVLEEQLRTYGVRVVYQRVPTDDTPEGNLLKHQLLSFAEYERAKITLRTSLGRRTKALAGKVVGTGRPPFGYRFVTESLENGQQRTASLEPDPATAPIAARIVRMARRASTREIANALMAEGIPSPTGGRWTSKVIHRIATNPTHIGQWRFGDITVAVAPLFAKADNRTPTDAWLNDWEAANAAMAERFNCSGARVSVSEDAFLLRGLLTCGHCGAALRSSSNGRHKDGSLLRYYVCGCHAPTRARTLGKAVCDLPDVPAESLEDEAWNVLTDTLLDPVVLTAGLEAARATHASAGRLQRDRLNTIDAEIATRRRKLNTLAEQLEDSAGEAADAIMRRMKEHETTIGQLHQERSSTTHTAGPGLSEREADAIREFAETNRAGIEHATLDDRRELFHSLRLRGMVYADPEGVLLGRRNRFRIEWEARIPLLRSASGFLKRDAL